MKKRSLFFVFSLVGITIAGAVYASSEQMPPRQVNWPFNGLFGKVDKPSAQRGLQVYKEVCAACHGLERVSFRTLSGIGFSEGEIKALAASYSVKDGPNDEGAMFERPGIPADKFVSPHANEQEARAAHNGAYPPDLSLIIKARENGANYVYSLLTGYGQAMPEQMHMSDGQYYNPYMAGGKIAMPAPLSDGQVTYEDGTQASVDQMAHDVVNFLQWAAEPEMEERKQLGLKVLAYLVVLTAFTYVAKKHIWNKLH